MNRIFRKLRARKAHLKMVMECMKTRFRLLHEALGDVSPWTDEESRHAERLFPDKGFFQPTRGWILPDGKIADFSGGTHHAAVYQAFSAERRGGMSPFDELRIYDEAMGAGLIRFGQGVLGIYVELLVPPTPEQLAVLDEIAEMRPSTDDIIHSYVECAGQYVEYTDFELQRRNLTRDAKRLADKRGA